MTCETYDLLSTPPNAPIALCPACEFSKRRPFSGAYNLGCVQCCARLVISAHPSKSHATSMLVAINRFPGSPGREKVLACVRHGLEKHR